MAETDGLPQIVMRSGEISRVVNQAEDALLRSGVQIYQRGGELVRPIRVEAGTVTKPDAVYRSPGSTMLTPVREVWLLEQASKAAIWYKRRRVGDVFLKSVDDPKAIYIHALLGRVGEWKFPALRGVVSAPTLAPDGRPVQSPGYDAETKLLVDIAPGVFPQVPDAPDKDLARECLNMLLHPLRGFPWSEPASCSVALSAMLTSLVRISMRTSPLHAIDSPTAGSGKSMLAETVGILATGTHPPAMSQGKTDEEDEKRLGAVLHAGDPVIHLDNCDLPVRGDFLCSMLTQEVLQARILGLSERRILPTTALVMATGNNLTLAGDVSRRAVICRIDSHTERPDERKFDFDARVEVGADRARLVTAGLTILRAYRLAGSPESLKPMGSFEDYSWIRGALVWLGMPDPAETRVKIFAGDPHREELAAVIRLWEKALGTQKIRVGSLAEMDTNTYQGAPEDLMALKAKLVEATGRPQWSSKSVGRWLMSKKDRVVDGKCLCCEADPTLGHKWRLAPAQKTLIEE